MVPPRDVTLEVSDELFRRADRSASGARRLRRVALQAAVRRRFTEARLFADHIRLNLRHSFPGRVLFRVRSTALNDPRISDPRFWRVDPTTLPNLERPRITEIEDVVQLQAAERVHIAELYPRVGALVLVPILCGGISHLAVSIIPSSVKIVEMIIIERYRALNCEMEVLKRGVVLDFDNAHALDPQV